MELNGMPSHIKSGVILLCRCKQKPFFVGRILVVDRVRKRCYARFEDNVTHWCDFSDIQNSGPKCHDNMYISLLELKSILPPTEVCCCSSSQCCLCNKNSTANLIKCSGCGLGFHWKCHNPAVVSSLSGNWLCRVCTFKATASPNNVLSHGMPPRPNRNRKRTSADSPNEVSGSLPFRRKKNHSFKRAVDFSSKSASALSELANIRTSDEVLSFQTAHPNDCSVRPLPLATTAPTSVDENGSQNCVPVKLCAFRSSTKRLMHRRVPRAHWIQSRAKQRYKPRLPRLRGTCLRVGSPSFETNSVPLTSLKLPQNVIDVSVIDAAVANENVSHTTNECLHNAINRHFGAVGRLKAGARCRITARRCTSDQRVEYLIQWDNGVII